MQQRHTELGEENTEYGTYASLGKRLTALIESWNKNYGPSSAYQKMKNLAEAKSYDAMVVLLGTTSVSKIPDAVLEEFCQMAAEGVCALAQTYYDSADYQSVLDMQVAAYVPHFPADKAEQFKTIYGDCCLKRMQSLYDNKEYQQVAIVYTGISSALMDKEDLQINTILANSYKKLADTAIREKRYKDAYIALTNGRSLVAVQELKDELAAKCQKLVDDRRPSNGKVLKSTVSWGYGQLTIVNNNEEKVVRVENVADSSKYVLVYLYADKKTTINLPDGSYEAYEITGVGYMDAESLFASGMKEEKIGWLGGSVMTFETRYYSDGTSYTTYTLTIG